MKLFQAVDGACVEVLQRFLTVLVVYLDEILSGSQVTTLRLQVR